MIKLIFTRTAVTFVLAASALFGQTTTIQQDYTYGYAPVILQTLRAYETDVASNLQPGKAPINQFAYAQTLVNAIDGGTIPFPNVDTLYENAWLDVSTPVVLHVPAMAPPAGSATPRYYLIPMLDAYSNVFKSVGTTATGSGAGNYEIVGPNWTGSPEANVTAVIQAPTNTVWLLGRTLVYGSDDLAAAVAAASQYKIIPIASFPTFLTKGQYTPPLCIVNAPPTCIKVAAPNGDFDTFPLGTGIGFSEPEFFDALAVYALENPDPTGLGLPFVRDGLLDRAQLTAAVATATLTADDLDFTSSAVHENGWSIAPIIGTYGTNYAIRTAVANLALGANRREDAVYFQTGTDNNGNTLNGSNNYSIHIPAAQIPPQSGFWSVTAYTQSGSLVQTFPGQNLASKYDVGSENGPVINSDGSIDIYLQNSVAYEHWNNWLPIPKEPFTLVLRVYGPGPTVLSGAWVPPTVSVTTTSVD